MFPPGRRCQFGCFVVLVVGQGRHTGSLSFSLWAEAVRLFVLSLRLICAGAVSLDFGLCLCRGCERSARMCETHPLSACACDETGRGGVVPDRVKAQGAVICQTSIARRSSPPISKTVHMPHMMFSNFICVSCSIFGAVPLGTGLGDMSAIYRTASRTICPSNSV